MQKREHSAHKLPRIPSGDGSLSSKLFNLTGLRVFQAKFMADIKTPPASRQPENKNPPTPVKAPPTNQFTGQDTLNQMPSTPLKLEKTSAPELKKVAKVKTKCMRPRGLKNLGNTCYMYQMCDLGTQFFRLCSVWKSSTLLLRRTSRGRRVPKGSVQPMPVS